MPTPAHIPSTPIRVKMGIEPGQWDGIRRAGSHDPAHIVEHASPSTPRHGWVLSSLKPCHRPGRRWAPQRRSTKPPTHTPWRRWVPPPTKPPTKPSINKPSPPSYCSGWAIDPSLTPPTKPPVYCGWAIHKSPTPPPLTPLGTSMYTPSSGWGKGNSSSGRSRLRRIPRPSPELALQPSEFAEPSSLRADPWGGVGRL